MPYFDIPSQFALECTCKHLRNNFSEYHWQKTLSNFFETSKTSTTIIESILSQLRPMYTAKNSDQSQNSIDPISWENPVLNDLVQTMNGYSVVWKAWSKVSIRSFLSETFSRTIFIVLLIV